MEGFLCYIKHRGQLFCSFVLPVCFFDRSYRSRVNTRLGLPSTIIIYTYYLVSNIDNSPFHSQNCHSLDRGVNIF